MLPQFSPKHKIALLLLSLACATHATMIGLNCGGPEASGTVSGTNIGVTGLYQQSNWNNVLTTAAVPSPTATSTYEGLVDSNGHSLGSGTSGFYVKSYLYGQAGVYNAGASGALSPADSGPRDAGNNALAGNLFNGYVHCASTAEGEGAVTMSLFNIPYDQFNIIIYTGNVNTNLAVRTWVGATSWNIAGTPQDGTVTDQGIMKGIDYSDSWQESSHDGTTGGNYFVLSGLTTTDGHLDMQLYKGGSSPGWGVVFAYQIVEIPEPAALSLSALGGMLLFRRRR